MEVSEAKRLRELEAENAKLKRLLAEAELDKAALWSCRGKMVTATQRRRASITSRVAASANAEPAG